MKIKYDRLIIGLDFGGNKSRHAIALSGIYNNNLYTLKTRCLEANGVTPLQLYEWVQKFINDSIEDYGKVNYLYADSAEQTLINGLRKNIVIPIYNSIKNPINERIRAKNILLASERYKVVKEECQDIIDFYRDAVWDETKDDDVRLDNGSYNNDIGDAEEYSWEYELNRLIRR